VLAVLHVDELTPDRRMLHAASRSALWPTASGMKIDVAKPST
jgi:hypothetical protein